jgi:hypothetical protein
VQVYGFGVSIVYDLCHHVPTAKTTQGRDAVGAVELHQRALWGGGQYHWMALHTIACHGVHEWLSAGGVGVFMQKNIV